MARPPHTRILQHAAEPCFDLTVVTVCRNVLPQLKRTTASVLGQKAVFPGVSIEHVIVDGASTDGTTEWLAEMKAQGKIEAYVSEPDCGIYDAMNKGINIARGRVLLFLNADDVLEHCDLSPCLTPILSGRTRTVAANARHYSGGKVSIFRPAMERMFIACPICHQAYFAETSLYRELGGYRGEVYACMADRDFMYRAANESGFPHIVDTLVTTMPGGGFSENSEYHFCDEKAQLLHENKVMLTERSRQDRDFCEMLVAALLDICVSLRRWQLFHSRDITERILKLQDFCREMQNITDSRKGKAALKFAAGPYLTSILNRKQCSQYQWFRIRRHRAVCHPSPHNPYSSGSRSYGLSISSTLRYYCRKLTSRLLH